MGARRQIAPIDGPVALSSIRFLPIGASLLLMQNPLSPTPQRWTVVAPHCTPRLPPRPPPQTPLAVAAAALDHPLLPHLTRRHPSNPIDLLSFPSSMRRITGGSGATTFLYRLLEDMAAAFLNQLWRALWHSSPSSWRLPSHPTRSGF
uniref:Uncharacterized protein n=1 Tax=Oryza sativa subsp. japonica TaxID=39947 RepID=Q6YSG8_ORYSJ|nr:hypothetical protein [Oryza sativa Japonica Group]BAD31575.1 hypothetical protein [Oryza sativa Japonica Group]